MKVVLAGSHGFIGSYLKRYFKERGNTVVALSRKPGGKEPFWDPYARQMEKTHLEGADVVINLAGENVLGRWTQTKIERIRQSRYAATSFLCDTILTLNHPPKLYIGASAVGFYGERGREKLTEESTSGHGYLAAICRHWEELTEPLIRANIRVALCRFGIVLGKEGGAFKRMLPPFKLGIGGQLGDGKQMVSWITIEDLAGACQHIIAHKELDGAINFCAPGAVTNAEMTQALGEVLHRPTKFPLPKFILKLLYGSGVEVFLSSIHAEPAKLLKSGYQFHHPEVKNAFFSLLSRDR
ncbi:MAG: TIGR01777 family oxidoreductase [Chlamydiales bacterium]